MRNLSGPSKFVVTVSRIWAAIRGVLGTHHDGHGPPGLDLACRLARSTPALANDVEPHPAIVDPRAGLHTGLQQVRCSEEGCHDPVCGIAINLLGRSDLLNSTAIHHDHTVGQRHRFGLIMRHVQARHAKPSLDRTKLVAHLQTSLASRLLRGSSSSSTSGSKTRARAIATRCCWPPDSAGAGRSANPASRQGEVPWRRDRVSRPRICGEPAADRRRSRRRSCAARWRMTGTPCRAAGAPTEQRSREPHR